MTWLLDPAQTELRARVSYTSDHDWYCSVVNSKFTLALNKALYSECGLQCRKSRDVTKSRDLYVFECDLSQISPYTKTRLDYCFENVLKHTYTWCFSDVTTPTDDVTLSRVSLPASIETTDSLQDICDGIAAQIMKISSSEHDNGINSFVIESHTPSVECYPYHGSTCITGNNLNKITSKYQDQIRFLHLVSVKTTSDVSCHVTCIFSGSDDLYLLKYEAR